MERKERMSVRETRAALIESGFEQFLEPRTDLGLGRISFGDAIARSGVSRASAYRSFTNESGDPQDEFRLAVLLEVISRTIIDTSVVGEVLSGLNPNDYDSSPDGQAAELREIIRKWTELSLHSNRANELVRAVDVCRAVVSLSPDPDTEILAAIRHSFDRSRSEFYPYLTAISERYGIRTRPWTTMDQVQRLFSSTIGMAMMEWSLDETTRVIVRPTGPNGTDQDWTMSGMIIEGIALNMFEPDPDAELSANLRSWLD